MNQDRAQQINAPDKPVIIAFGFKMKTVILNIILVFLILPIRLDAGQDDALPSRETEKVMSYLSKYNDKKNYDYIESLLGLPDSDIGSGIFVLTFNLSDETTITIGTPDKNEVFYIKHSGPGIDGTIEIYKKTEKPAPQRFGPKSGPHS